MSNPGGAVHLRADARRNRDQILLAARQAFIEQGSDAPFDAIARRAGVGIATLYRRFPERQALMRAVVLDVLGQVALEARAALMEEPDAFRGLARYMHRALSLRVASVMPVLVGQVSLDDEAIVRVRRAATEPIEELIRRARVEGTLRPDATFGDIGLLLIRLSRPLPGPFPAALDESLAHRHLDLVLDGLRAGVGLSLLPGPGLTLEALQNLPPVEARAADRHVPDRWVEEYDREEQRAHRFTGPQRRTDEDQTYERVRRRPGEGPGVLHGEAGLPEEE